MYYQLSKYVSFKCEGWITDAGQFLHGISKQAPQCKSSADVDRLIAQIQKYKQDGAMLQDGRLGNMERIATELYGMPFTHVAVLHYKN